MMVPSVSSVSMQLSEARAHADLLRIGFQRVSEHPTLTWHTAEEHHCLPPVLYNLLAGFHERHAPLATWACIYLPAIYTLGRLYRLCRENHDARILVLADPHVAAQMRWAWGRHITNKEVRALEQSDRVLLLEDWEALGELIPDQILQQFE